MEMQFEASEWMIVWLGLGGKNGWNIVGQLTMDIRGIEVWIV